MAGPPRLTAREVVQYFDGESPSNSSMEDFCRRVEEEEERLEVDSEVEPEGDSGSDSDRVESLLVEAYNLQSVAGPSTTPAERDSLLHLDPDMNSELNLDKLASYLYDYGTLVTELG